MKAAILGTGLFALTCIPAALASGDEAIDDGSGQRIPVSLGEAKAKCMELAANEQLRPFTIKVECMRERTFWLEEKNSLRLPNSFSFSGKALIKNLYEIKPDKPLDQSQMLVKECPRFVEYKQKMELWQNVPIKDCKELNAIADLASHCKEALGSETNLQELAPEATGRTIDTCAVQLPTQQSDQSPSQSPGQSPSQSPGHGQTPGQEPGQTSGQQTGGQASGQEGSDASAAAPTALSNFGAQLAPKTLSTSSGTIVGLEVRGRINLNTLAGRLGLNERDVVTRVNGSPVAKVSDLAQALRQAHSGDKIVKMTVWRATASRWTFVEARM